MSRLEIHDMIGHTLIFKNYLNVFEISRRLYFSRRMAITIIIRMMTIVAITTPTVVPTREAVDAERTFGHCSTGILEFKVQKLSRTSGGGKWRISKSAHI